MIRKAVRKDLRNVTLEGSAYSVMAGLGEASFPAYVLALGHSQVSAGLVTTLPLFLGSLLQNLCPPLLKRVGSLRRWMVGAVLLQGFFLLALAGASSSLALIFLAISLYWAANWACGPAFNTWVETLVPRGVRPNYFARRTALCKLVEFSCMLAAGWILTRGKASGHVIETFMLLFVLAGLARLTSAFFVSQQTDARLPQGFRVLSFRQAYQVVHASPQARALFYLLGAQFSLQMAVPLVSPFLLAVHKLEYLPYMAVVSTLVASRIVALRFLGTQVRRIGPRKMFWLSGAGLVPVPLLWLMIGPHVALMVLLQAYTGFLMAAYDLAVMMTYMEAIPAAERTSVLTRFSVVQTLAMLGGSGVGSLVLLTVGSTYAGYAVAFGLSVVARIAALKVLELVPVQAPRVEFLAIPPRPKTEAQGAVPGLAAGTLLTRVAVRAETRPREVALTELEVKAPSRN